MTGMAGWLLKSPQNTWWDDNTVTAGALKKAPEEGRQARPPKTLSRKYTGEKKRSNNFVVKVDFVTYHFVSSVFLPFSKFFFTKETK